MNIIECFTFRVNKAFNPKQAKKSIVLQENDFLENSRKKHKKKVKYIYLVILKVSYLNYPCGPDFNEK